MEVEAPLHASRATAPTPDGLRQRQRDRMTPRGRVTKEIRDGHQQYPPRPKTAAQAVSEVSSAKQDALRRSNSAGRRKDQKQSLGSIAVARTPETTSAGREGRQFTVANVGNNGRIYLRPSVRPANQRTPPPPFNFPMTPPGTAGLENLALHDKDDESQRESVWTLTSPLPSSPQLGPHSIRPFGAKADRYHKRAHSYSTVDEHHAPIEESEFGAFKVVIERPGTERGRPSTSDGHGAMSMLEVAIPSWRIGSPRFSTRGTAFIRGSSYATSDGMRSSTLTEEYGFSNLSGNRKSQAGPHALGSGSPNSLQPRFLRINPDEIPETPPLRSPSVARLQNRVIEPSMFDELTFKPSCDDRSLVRYAANGALTAATPPRLVAEITSQTFLDYDLLSDFFLTFRAFLAPADLLSLLIARLRWALARSDEVGMVVRVRTFVALRHWILNYFMDDFVLDYELRKMFCRLINAFVQEILENPNAERNQVKILAELKKCWRRTCSLFWDGPDFAADLGQESPVNPGGMAGSRDPDLTPDFWAQPSEPGPPQLSDIFDQDSSFTTAFNFFADVPSAGDIPAIKPFVRPESNNTEVADLDAQQNNVSSRESVLSQEVTSCSFPARPKPGSGNSNALGPRPIPVGSSYYGTTASASNYTKSVKKRQNLTLKRSGSFSDSFRHGVDPLQTMVYKSTELFMSVPYAGSLVRGNMFPPGQAFVDFIAPATPAETIRAATYFQKDVALPKEPSAMSSPGMKKLLCGVRRALGNKQILGSNPVSSPTTGAFPPLSPLSSRGVSVNRLPGSATVPPHPSLRTNGTRVPMRIDLLGAGVAEDFKRAIREDAEAAAEALRQEDFPDSDIGIASGNHSQFPSIESNSDRPDGSIRDRNPISGITAGSQSIVIFDDTLASSLPRMTGALSVRHSIDTITDSYMHTPPCTPPEQQQDFPRRSSHLLGTPDYGLNRSLSIERTPSLVHDLRDPSLTEQSPSLTRALPALPVHARSRSKRSVSLRRYASFQSSFTRHAPDTSFDATVPESPRARVSFVPLAVGGHALRRRPGGDLRGATNVGDLHNAPLRRTRSIGSIDTYSDSGRSSFFFGRGSSQYPDGMDSETYSATNHGPFSLRHLAAPSSAQRELSLVSTSSSQPRMRPSFEKEAAKLAQIPDDEDDDGGIESALLKLEGRFDETRRSRSSDEIRPLLADSKDGERSTAQASQRSVNSSAQDQRESKQLEETDRIVERTQPPVYRPQQLPPGQEALKPLVYQPRQLQEPFRSRETKQSEESYSSIPLLQREFSMDGADRQSKKGWRNVSILSSAGGNAPTGEETPDSLYATLQHHREPLGLRRMKPMMLDGSVEPSADDADDANSDLSSEMSFDGTRDSHRSPTPIEPSPKQNLNPSSLPLGPLQLPSSPTMSIGQALSMTPNAYSPSPYSPLLYSPQLYSTQSRHNFKGALPPTPDTTPTLPDNAKDGHWDAEGLIKPTLTTIQPAAASRQTSVHLPFVLAFDSKVLAQQFTLVEKDALNEIDWKELIDMHWRNATSNSRSWVDFLRTQDARGVEVVIGRFNIMCKWAISEIVLTRNLEERAQCITKYIHIAAHCRTYRNYATLYQLTIALTGSEVTRLKTTWSHISAADKQTLKDLEILVQPVRNFHNLRAEMEGEGAGVGCIPFIGVYTHDLLFNSQRPSVIASTPLSEPLINFERCRTSAAIVKNLLRLLEASQLYEFSPIEGVTERCLWLAALSDNEIRKLGDGID